MGGEFARCLAPDQFGMALGTLVGEGAPSAQHTGASIEGVTGASGAEVVPRLGEFGNGLVYFDLGYRDVHD